MAIREELDQHTLALIQKAVLVTQEQARRSGEILFALGLDQSNPQAPLIRASVLQSLAMNFNAVAIKSMK